MARTDGKNGPSCIGCAGESPGKKPTNSASCYQHQESTRCLSKSLSAQEIDDLLALLIHYKGVKNSACQARDSYRKLKEKYTTILLDLQLAVITQGYDEKILYGLSWNGKKKIVC